MIRDEVSISMETYLTVLEKENLGEPHPTLPGAHLWYPPDEEHRRNVRVLNELRRQGLIQGTRVSDDFLETLTVMQRASVEYYTFIANKETGQTTVRTAAIGRDAVLVQWAGDDVIKIAPIPVEQMGVRLAVALPETPAAQVHSMSCDNADLVALSKDKSLPQSGSLRDAKRMKRWLDMERVHVGQLFVAVRDNANTRRSTQAPVPCWIDTESERVLFSPDRNGWVNLVGADMLTIAGKLEVLEKVLRGVH